MSVYIKGMEMPKSCFSCPMNDTDCCGISRGSYIEYREVDVDVAINGRPEWCPLIPVPDHGDLIDRTTVKDYWLYADWDTGMDLGKEKNAFAVINSVPTIIPGEERS